MNAWFGLTASLFTLDQYVQWTALRVQGEGRGGQSFVVFRLTAKVFFLRFKILSFMFITL